MNGASGDPQIACWEKEARQWDQLAVYFEQKARTETGAYKRQCLARAAARRGEAQHIRDRIRARTTAAVHGS